MKTAKYAPCLSAFPPEGFREVSESDFFAAVSRSTDDPMPSTQFPMETVWKTRGGAVWGWALPGWSNPGDPARYAVRK